jgi:outer membrane lipoprotein-sorting protein
MLFPKRISLALAASSSAVLVATALAASTQTAPAAPAAITIVNRMNSAYRSARSFKDVATVKRVVGRQETSGTLTIAIQRPNHYLLDLKGDKLNTTVVCDGSTLIAMRPDRKVYTKARAPQLLMGSDVLAGVQLPSPGPRIITQLLAAAGREGEVGKMLLNAKVEGPLPFGGKTAWALTFRFDDETDAKVTVGADDYLVRQVELLHGDKVEWTETHDNVQIDKAVDGSEFVRPLPVGALVVSVLPPLDKPVAAEDAETVEDVAKDPAKLEKTALALYRSSGCGRCHNGGAGPDLSHEGADPEHTAKWIADHIKNPQMHTPGSSMPAFRGKISDRNIDLLATYLASNK